MRYIGSKLKLIEFISDTIANYCGINITGKTFCDLFSGTGIVGKSFAPLVRKVIANDLEYYSYIANKVALKGFDRKEVEEQLKIINAIEPDYNCTFAQYYAEGGTANRLFYTKENGAKIGAARNYVDSIKDSISEQSYYALILSIINGSDDIANCTGVYGAFLKDFKPGALKPVVFKIPEVAKSDMSIQVNEIYNSDANELIKNINGDILYLDPPYNTRQYSSNYHILNYIALNEYPDTVSIAGLGEHNKSKYSSKKDAAAELDELIKNADFEWIFLSYNNEGTIPFETIKNIMSKYGEYSVECKEHQRYKADSNRRNLAGTDKTIEYIHVLHKVDNLNTKVDTNLTTNCTPTIDNIDEEKNIDKEYIISPMNYMGGKKKLLPIISQYFPREINKFVDLFCGGCTVGINSNAKEIIFNDNLKQLVILYQYFSTHDSNEIIEYIEKTVTENKLNITDTEAYNAFKKKYNEDEFANPLDLFILIAFGFNNQVRFNSKNEFNIPFGLNRSGWNPKMKKNLINFVNALNTKNISFESKDFRKFNFDKLNEGDFVYLDPPYLISQATYNSGWDENTEIEFLNIVKELDNRHIKFALSNVLENKGLSNDILKKWAEENNFRIIHIAQSYANSAYCRKEKDTVTDEVLIINY